MKLQNKRLVTKLQLLDILRNEQCEIVLTMGAGDIDSLAGDIIEILKTKE